MLLEARADLNVANLNGSTALMCACEKGNVEIAGVFLEAGAWTGIKK